MSPGSSKPFDTRAIAGIHGEGAERFDDLSRTHRLETVEQRTRIIDHDTGFIPFANQGRYDRAQSFVTITKNGGVVAISI
jgi:hypothetical protein